MKDLNFEEKTFSDMDFLYDDSPTNQHEANFEFKDHTIISLCNERFVKFRAISD